MPRLFFLLLIIFVVGCTAAPPGAETPLPESTLTSTETPVPTLEITEPKSEGPIILKVWVPPQFDPASDSPAGKLFQARLDEFAARRSNVNIEVRIKDVEGPGGILDTLTTAIAAAPLAVPDLVALPQHGVEIAAENNVIHPFDGLTTILDDPDWYNFARQLSFLQNSTFGVPFAGDALLMNYRPEQVVAPPVDWAASLAITSTLTFPAADQNALVTLLHYQSLGGSLIGENDQLMLDEATLTDVLTYYQQASVSELMPFWLTQYETDEQSWQAYEQMQADLAITWVSRYLTLLPDDTEAAPIPTFNGDPFTLADGWVWALTANNPERQLLAAQLAEFLTTSEYLASWSEAAGLIPPHPSSLTAWDNSAHKTLLTQIAPNAQLMPSLEVTTILGPILQQATVSVLKAEADAVTAAQSAVEKLSVP